MATEEAKKYITWTNASLSTAIGEQSRMAGWEAEFEFPLIEPKKKKIQDDCELRLFESADASPNPYDLLRTEVAENQPILRLPNGLDTFER